MAGLFRDEGLLKLLPMLSSAAPDVTQEQSQASGALMTEKVEAAAVQDDVNMLDLASLDEAAEMSSQFAMDLAKSAELQAAELQKAQSAVARVDEINNNIGLRIIEPIAGIFSTKYSREKLERNAATALQNVQLIDAQQDVEKDVLAAKLDVKARQALARQQQVKTEDDQAARLGDIVNETQIARTRAFGKIDELLASGSEKEIADAVARGNVSPQKAKEESERRVLKSRQMAMSAISLEMTQLQARETRLTALTDEQLAEMDKKDPFVEGETRRRENARANSEAIARNATTLKMADAIESNDPAALKALLDAGEITQAQYDVGVEKGKLGRDKRIAEANEMRAKNREQSNKLAIDLFSSLPGSEQELLVQMAEEDGEGTIELQDGLKIKLADAASVMTAAFDARANAAMSGEGFARRMQDMFSPVLPDGLVDDPKNLPESSGNPIVDLAQNTSYAAVNTPDVSPEGRKEMQTVAQQLASIAKTVNETPTLMTKMAPAIQKLQDQLTELDTKEKDRRARRDASWFGEDYAGWKKENPDVPAPGTIARKAAINFLLNTQGDTNTMVTNGLSPIWANAAKAAYQKSDAARQAAIAANVLGIEAQFKGPKNTKAAREADAAAVMFTQSPAEMENAKVTTATNVATRIVIDAVEQTAKDFLDNELLEKQGIPRELAAQRVAQAVAERAKTETGAIDVSKIPEIVTGLLGKNTDMVMKFQTNINKTFDETKAMLKPKTPADSNTVQLLFGTPDPSADLESKIRMTLTQVNGNADKVVAPEGAFTKFFKALTAPGTARTGMDSGGAVRKSDLTEVIQ